KSCNAAVCMGGIHPTIKPMEGIQHEAVDFVVFGEGEITFMQLASALHAGKRDFSEIDGLVFKHDGKAVKNKPRELIENIDLLPFPARHLFKMDRYTYPDALKSPAISIITSRGCPGQCTYCCTKCIFGLRYRFRSADNVIAEIEQIIKQYGAKEIHIWDDNFTANKKRVLEFCRKIREKGIHKRVQFSVPQGLRVDHVNEEVLRALKSINVYSIGYGIESGNDEILRLCKKNITTAKARETIRLSKKLGFDTWCFFILGLYGDTEETIRQTIDFAKELDPLFAKFLILKPLPGTEVFDQLEAAGLVIERNYDKFGLYAKPIHRLPTVSPERLVQLQNQAFREFYFRPQKILQHLLRLRSWHRFKLNVSAALAITKLALARKDF
ncbi:MAG: radical SAM protein, partial [Candidatus Diapherotrites archaeon]|nr:radical SAM protein [Candidatus Diapherotrites archaeon]